MSVPGEGPTPADLMIVGEAPGRQEVVEGRPFIGPSGQMLKLLLGSFNYERDDCYITNVFKELPLDDEGKIRRPEQHECEEGMVELTNELLAVDPKVILLLGTTAYRAISGDWTNRVPWGTLWMRGSEPYHKTFCTIWHPAYLLRGREKDFSLWRQQAEPLFEALGDSR